MNYYETEICDKYRENNIERSYTKVTRASYGSKPTTCQAVCIFRYDFMRKLIVFCTIATLQERVCIASKM